MNFMYMVAFANKNVSIIIKSNKNKKKVLDSRTFLLFIFSILPVHYQMEYKMITVKWSGWLQKGINPCRNNALDYHIVFIEDLQINLYKVSHKQLR